MLAFGFLYLPQYFSFPSADFQKEFAQDLQNDNIQRLAECDFRESGKSVWSTLIYPLWCICYKKRDFIIIGSEISTNAIIHLGNIINVLETNEIIIQDFGILYRQQREFFGETKKKTVADFITENSIRLMAIGKGQAIRGLRHREHRPDLFIGDDLDSNKSVLNIEQRDKTHRWLKSEILSGINQEYGKAVIVGNMIHFDCLMARLKADDLWKYRGVPIYESGKLSWPERHLWTREEADEYNQDKPKKEHKISIEQIKDDKGSLVFAQEYLLQPMSEKERIFRPEWIKYYKEIPKKDFQIVKGRIDPAAKEKESSDYSAIAIGIRDKRDGKIYIVDVWQGKVSEKTKANKIYEKHQTWDTEEFIVEDNAYQDVLKQRVVEMKEEGKYVPVRGVTTHKDKVTRALAIQPYIERGDVLFNPELDRITKITGDNRSQGAIEQLTQFPVAPNDDMVDAIIGVIEALIKRTTPLVIGEDEEKPQTAGLMTKQF